MTAIVLGLLVASAKGYYDTQSAELTAMFARIVLLDRILAHYGPETQRPGGLLRNMAVRLIHIPSDPLRNVLTNLGR